MKRLAIPVLVALIGFAGCTPWRTEVLNQWPADQRVMAACIAERESGWDVRQVSDTDDWGLYQLHRPSWERKWRDVMGRPWSDTLNPYWNTVFARRYVYGEHGSWRPWATRRYCISHIANDTFTLA